MKEKGKFAPADAPRIHLEVAQTGLRHREYGVGCDSGDRDDFVGRVTHGGSLQRRRASSELQSLSSTNSRIQQFFKIL